MRKGRISEARSVQREQEPGARTEEDCGRDGVSSTTFYRKARYRRPPRFVIGPARAPARTGLVPSYQPHGTPLLSEKVSGQVTGSNTRVAERSPTG